MYSRLILDNAYNLWYDTAYCLKSHCGVRGYCRSQAGVSVQIICKFSNERTCTRKKDVEGLSCGFEDNLKISLIDVLLISVMQVIVFDY